MPRPLECIRAAQTEEAWEANNQMRNVPYSSVLVSFAKSSLFVVLASDPSIHVHPIAIQTMLALIF